jgi:hypothetical protein
MATGQALLYLVLDRKRQLGIRRETTKPSQIASVPCPRLHPQSICAVRTVASEMGFRVRKALREIYWRLEAMKPFVSVCMK